MSSLEFFIGGFLVGVFATLFLCARARRRNRQTQAPTPDVSQQGSATTQAPDELSKIGRETGAEIIDD